MLTTNDIKEELSIAYVHAIATRAGFSMEVIRKDRDSIDVSVRGRGLFSLGSTLSSPSIDIQLKAHVIDPLPDDSFPFDLPVKNYNDLIGRCLVPRILVVFTMPEDSEQWLSLTEEALVLRRSAYWMSLLGSSATENSATKRVIISRNQVFECESLKALLTKVSEEVEIR